MIDSGLISEINFGLLGQAATFYPANGDPIETQALHRESVENVGEFTNSVDFRESITLPTADVGRPKRGRVTINGIEWQLDGIAKSSLDSVTLWAYRDE